jgi:hypothetical protein
MPLWAAGTTASPTTSPVSSNRPLPDNTGFRMTSCRCPPDLQVDQPEEIQSGQRVTRAARVLRVSMDTGGHHGGLTTSGLRTEAVDRDEYGRLGL